MELDQEQWQEVLARPELSQAVSEVQDIARELVPQLPKKPLLEHTQPLRPRFDALRSPLTNIRQVIPGAVPPVQASSTVLASWLQSLSQVTN